ncbi:MAG: prolipoprotein diacylglyceryl transferase [Clostridiales bacterium]|nr:prolipoprotein diacylglyceryl transferase [Clostridiales bacterium]
MSFTIFGKVVPFYGLFYFLGIGVAALVAVFLIKKRKLSGYELTYSAIFAVLGGVVGAKLLYCLVSIKDVITFIKAGDFASIMKGGFVFYGGLIGGAFGLWLYGKCFKMKMTDYYEVFATVFPLGHALGRVGCQLAGCCYGVEYDGFFSLPTWCGFYDPNTMEIVYYGWGPNRLAVPVLEASVLLILFAVLMWFYYKKPHLKLNTTIYCLTYAAWRFFIEFFRGDEARGKFLLSTSQWISIAIVLFVVGLLLYKKYGKKKAVVENVSESVEKTENATPVETETNAETVETVQETETVEAVETTDTTENKTE